MVRQTTDFNGRQGFILSDTDFKNMERHEINGKVKYFIPAKKTREPPGIDRDLVISMYREGKNNKEIAAFYNHSVSWLFTQLTKIFGSSSKPVILSRYGAIQEDNQSRGAELCDK